VDFLFEFDDFVECSDGAGDLWLSEDSGSEFVTNEECTNEVGEGDGEVVLIMNRELILLEGNCGCGGGRGGNSINSLGIDFSIVLISDGGIIVGTEFK
jgi:hypothetical protein